MNYKARITGMLKETHDTISIRFEKPEGFSYIAGHYAVFEHNIEGEILKRSYSLSSSPSEDFLQITVKQIPNGKMSNYLTGLKIGDELTFLGPLGKFIYEDSLKDVVFIAGGSGVGPFRSMCKYIADKQLETKVCMIYGSRSPRDIILRDFFESLNKEGKIRLFLTVDHPDPFWRLHTGFIDDSFLKEATENRFLGRVYFICGPPIMVTSMKSILMKLGVPEVDIRVDAWG